MYLYAYYVPGKVDRVVNKENSHCLQEDCIRKQSFRVRP